MRISTGSFRKRGDTLRAFGMAPEKMREQLQTALYG